MLLSAISKIECEVEFSKKENKRWDYYMERGENSINVEEKRMKTSMSKKRRLMEIRDKNVERDMRKD